MKNTMYAAALAVALIASPALAADETVVLRVRTGDLNLQTEQGAQVVLDRIARAANNACSSRETGRAIRYVDQACVASTSARAVEKLRAPIVQALYQAKTARTAQG